MELRINNQIKNLDIEETMPLLWAVRDELHMTGTKYGCGVSACGACTMIIDGVATRTCVLPASAAIGKQITTIEGIEKDGKLSAVQQAWIAHQVPQCGYCQSGMILATEALLDSTPNPTDEDIDTAITNICRCGTYQRIRDAVHMAAKARQNPEKIVE